MDCPPGVDNSIAPEYCNQFDFTLLFEHIVFQICPCSVFLLFVSFRLFQLSKQSVKIKQVGARTIKQLFTTALAATQLALLISWIVTSPSKRSKVSIPAAAVSFLSSLVLLVLSSIEHVRSIRPSSTISTYLTLTLVFDVVQARTLYLRPFPGDVRGSYTAGMGFKACLIYLEARRKVFSNQAAHAQPYAPEDVSSLYSRTTLWWLNGLLLDGYKGLLSPQSLPTLTADTVTGKLEKKFRQHWTEQSRHKRRPLLRALWRTTISNCLLVIPTRLCYSGFRLTQPLLINRITQWLGDAGGPTDDHRTQVGHSLIGATLLVYGGLAISTSLYKRQIHCLVTKVRGVIISSVCSKSLVLSSRELGNQAALSLVSNDTHRITQSMQQIDSLVTGPVEIAIAIFLLARQIGLSCVAPVAVTLGITLISMINSKQAVRVQKTWLESVQKRLAHTSAVLGHPKGFKMLGLAEALTDSLQALRITELQHFAAFRKYLTYRATFSAIPQALAGPATLSMVSGLKGIDAITPSLAFTTLSLVAVLTTPIQQIIHAIPMTMEILASLNRIETYLLLDEQTPCQDSENNRPEIHEHDWDALIPNTVQLSELPSSTSICPRTSENIEMLNAFVRSADTSQFVIEDITLSVKPETLTLITGPVGSGKSTLIKAIVGEIELSYGQINFARYTHNIAYCAQIPWFPNMTLRAVILGESGVVDEEWYSTVLEACALCDDISSFPSGDQTLVGTNGMSLSGGQRQRLALARALYSRKKVVVIDDALGEIDLQTWTHILQSVLGPNGLCRANKLTVIIASSHPKGLIRMVDQVILLTTGGKMNQFVNCLDLDNSSSTVETQDTRPKTASQEESDGGAPRNDRKAGREEAQQDLARQTGDIAVYSYYAKSIGWALGLVVAITSAVFVFGLKFSELWVRWWTESTVSERQPERVPGVWIGVYWGLSGAALISLAVHIYTMLVLTVPKSSAKLHKQVLMAVMRAPYSFFSKIELGTILNRFANDMSIIEDDLAGAVMETINDAGLFIGSAILIAASCKFVAATIPLILLILYAVQRFYLRTSRQLRFLDLEATGPLTAHLSECLSGIATIRAFSWGQQFHERALELIDLSQRPFYILLCIQRWLNLVMDLVTAAIAAVLVAFATSLPASSSSASSVGIALLNLVTLNSILNFLITAWTTLETALGAVSRCKNFESSTPSEETSDRSRAGGEKIELLELPSEWPSAGKVIISNVTASYGDGANVLQDLSLSIAAGDKIAICGRSGSGKTSLLLTILRLLEPASGEITIDDVNISNMSCSSLRKRLTTVPQEPFVLPGSVRDNIDALHTSTDDEVEAALRDVGLYDLIAERGGFGSSLTDMALSHGEKQLFGIARALLRKSKLLLLDEATSSLDEQEEARTMRLLIEKSFAQSTVITVTHRLNDSLSLFDRVVIVKEGSTVEMGTMSELLAKDGGIFRDMWSNRQNL